MAEKRLKVAVLTDCGEVQMFGLRAIDGLEVCHEVTVFSCTNTRIRRRAVRHGAYYALNLFSVRNPLTRSVPVTATRKRIAELVSFESGYEGSWQTLPPEVIARLNDFDIVLKFGLGLMRVPSPEQLSAPILSWHHGDPDHYRGRPAGFWEIVDGAPVMGQIVQVISNKLDAGRVVAFAETKVHPHSYRATLMEAYGVSHLLVNEAVRNAVSGRALDKHSTGRNRRLPSNWTVLRLVIRMAAAYVKRMVYGGFIEKGWNVSEAQLGSVDLRDIAEGRCFPPPASWRTLPTPVGYTFLADPFPSKRPPGILVEALSRKTALGEILLITEEGSTCLIGGSTHFSYPGTIEVDEDVFLVPEMEQSGEQRRFRLSQTIAEDAGHVAVENAQRLLDPTLVELDQRFYLFANDADHGSAALFLWVSETSAGPFRPHPLSPVRISPRGARMAGAIVRCEGRMIRFGQSFVRDYGDGVFAFEITDLSPQNYRERLMGEIRFGDRRGPHTINFVGNRVLFDWYRQRFSALSGARRLKALLSTRGLGIGRN